VGDKWREVVIDRLIT